MDVNQPAASNIPDARYISRRMAVGSHWLASSHRTNTSSSQPEMILTFCLLTLLVATNTGAQRIKGGPRILSQPSIQEPHIHVGKGGGGGALHHTAVVTDPVSLNPVVVEKVTSLGSSGGIKSAGFGPSSAQFTLADSQIPSFGQRALYRNGASQVPFGLSGLDYYSYPLSLLNARRSLGRKTVVGDNISGLRPIGFGRQSAIIADPTTSQFTVGDAQIRSNVFGGRGLYRTGLSPVPFGLSGLDYYSYPRSLLTQPRILGSGLGQTKILSGGGFSAGDAQISSIVAEPMGQEKVTIIGSEPSFGGPAMVQAAQDIVPEQVTTIVEDGGFGQRQVTTVTKSAGGLGGLRGGQIILRGGGGGLGRLGGLGGLRRVKSRPVIQAQAPVQDVQVLVDPTSGLGAPIGGYGQRQVAVTKSVAPAPVFSAPAQVFSPAPVIQAPAVAPIRRRLGEAFLTQVARPVVAARRVASIARPVAQVFNQPRVAVVPQAPAFPGNIQFTLGNTQIIGGPAAVAPAPIAVQRPAFAAVQRPSFAAVQRPSFAAVQRPAFAAVQRPVAIQRPVVAVQQPVAVQRPVVAVQQPVAVQRPVFSVQQPIAVQQPVSSGIKTSGFGGFGARRVLSRRIPQMVYVDGGNRYAGIDIIGGYRIGDPRYNYAQLPISSQRFANLGLSQGSIDAGPVLVAPPPAPAFATKSVPVVSTPIAKTTIAQSNPLGFTGIGQTGATKTITQEEVIGPAGDSQILTTVTQSGPSKIGGPVISGPSGLTGIGQTGATKTITQEEVIGPAGDSQILTTVTQSGPSKIGGPVISGPSGLTGIGQTGATKTITQEEVIGPAGDSQILTTVTQSGPSKIGGPVVSGPLGLTGIGQTGATKTITQEEVIGPAGDSQILTTVTQSGPSKIGGPVVSGPLGLTGIGQTGATKTITQEEVIGPAGDSQILTTVTQSGPSKIGGPVVSGPMGLTGIGQTSPAKVVTQEEVIGPAGDRQVVTTVTDAGPSKIGGQGFSNPFGLTSVGQAPTKVITQEEVIGPAGDSQVITTVSETSPSRIVQEEEAVGLSSVSALTASPLSQIAQDPIETTLSQSALGDSAIISSGPSAFSQSLIDPVGAGQTQLSIDDGFGSSSGGIVKETIVSEPAGILSDGSIGQTFTKITEVSQQPIGADPVVQQSISSGFEGGLGGYVPRVSFLSQYPYDVPDRAVLRQALTRPIVQEQQQLEQILV